MRVTSPSNRGVLPKPPSVRYRLISASGCGPPATATEDFQHHRTADDHESYLIARRTARSPSRPSPSARAARRRHSPRRRARLRLPAFGPSMTHPSSMLDANTGSVKASVRRPALPSKLTEATARSFDKGCTSSSTRSPRVTASARGRAHRGPHRLFPPRTGPSGGRRSANWKCKRCGRWRVFHPCVQTIDASPNRRAAKRFPILHVSTSADPKCQDGPGRSTGRSDREASATLHAPRAEDPARQVVRCC